MTDHETYPSNDNKRLDGLSQDLETRSHDRLAVDTQPSRTTQPDGSRWTATQSLATSKGALRPVVTDERRNPALPAARKTKLLPVFATESLSAQPGDLSARIFRPLLTPATKWPIPATT